MTIFSVAATFGVILMIVLGVALTMCILGHDKDGDGLP